MTNHRFPIKLESPDMLCELCSAVTETTDSRLKCFVRVSVKEIGLEVLLCLFGVLRRFQHCTGHITTGSWKGRGNQYI